MTGPGATVGLGSSFAGLAPPGSGGVVLRCVGLVEPMFVGRI